MSEIRIERVREKGIKVNDIPAGRYAVVIGGGSEIRVELLENGTTVEIDVEYN